MAESLIPRTLQALHTLDLIDEQGKPSETLEGIRLAPEAEYKQRLSQWLKGAYADVLAFVDPASDDEIAIRDAFRNYQPVGQQPRMVTLFLGLAAAAGMAAEKHEGQSKRARTPPTQTIKTAGPTGQGSKNNSSPRNTPENPKSAVHAPHVKQEISEKAMEYRLVDLMTEAAGKPNVMNAIIEVITFLKTKDVTEPAKQKNEAGGKEEK